MEEDWRKFWRIKVKKAALSYKTGWEYLPESQEAGSVLTDLFLDMELENRKRFDRIWEKKEGEFLSVAPQAPEEPRRLETMLLVRAAEETDGQWLEENTRVYAMTQQGALLNFRTVRPLRLTAAKLQWVICRRGLSAWLCYQKGDAFPISLSASPDRVLAHPVFRWRFRGLLDGHDSFSFTVEFEEAVDLGTELPGSWAFSDGRSSYPALWQQSCAGALLRGECPEFAGNLEGGVYELCLELSVEDTLSKGWLSALTKGFFLKEEAAVLEPELCLTEIGPGGSGRILPFGNEPETAACFYLSCDRAAAGASGELALQFTEDYETEEKCPAPEPEEYKKLYRKYPWLRRTEEVQEWRAAETLWEYFDGRIWRVLPGSEGWNTGCRPEEPGEKLCRFLTPGDIMPCSMEGEEHIYLRLRVLRAEGAYAPYYRKRIPVLLGIRIRTGERVFKPEEQDVPGQQEAEQMYLGFDREILPENCWYTKRGCIRFAPEQIKGWGDRCGKSACWVELPLEGEELMLPQPNCAEIWQDAEGEKEAGPDQIPQNTVFHVESEKLGALDGISVIDARYDRAGAPVLDEKKAAGNYLSHFGRMLTTADLELLLQERYPFFGVEQCSFCREKNQLQVKLTVLPGEAGAEARLPEVNGWLTGAIRRLGGIWLQEAEVNCVLPGEGRQDEGGRDIGNIEAG